MKLLLIGCGNMGYPLLTTWIKHSTFEQIVVVQPSLSVAEKFKDNSALKVVKSSNMIPLNFTPDIVLFAVKPYLIHSILKEYTSYAQSAIFISIAAGISVKDLYACLNNNVQLVRIMPNIAVQVGASANLAYYDETKKNKNLISIIENVFQCTGVTIWLKDESLFDILTPISGSGPAYFYSFAQELEKHAINSGLDAISANKLISQTLLGSALLTQVNNDFQHLKQTVTSKGGVTEAALKVLEENLSLLVKDALRAAQLRLKELKKTP